jgi:hypothetical protein
MNVNTKKVLTRSQNLAFIIGECFAFVLRALIGAKNKMSRDITRARTPPSFDGTDRRIV